MIVTESAGKAEPPGSPILYGSETVEANVSMERLPVAREDEKCLVLPQFETPELNVNPEEETIEKNNNHIDIRQVSCFNTDGDSVQNNVTCIDETSEENGYLSIDGKSAGNGYSGIDGQNKEKGSDIKNERKTVKNGFTSIDGQNEQTDSFSTDRETEQNGYTFMDGVELIFSTEFDLSSLQACAETVTDDGVSPSKNACSFSNVKFVSK